MNNGIVVSGVFEFQVVDPGPTLCLRTLIDTPDGVVFTVCRAVSALGATPTEAVDKHRFFLAFAGRVWEDAKRHAHPVLRGWCCVRGSQFPLAEVGVARFPQIHLQESKCTDMVVLDRGN